MTDDIATADSIWKKCKDANGKYSINDMLIMAIEEGRKAAYEDAAAIADRMAEDFEEGRRERLSGREIGEAIRRMVIVAGHAMRREQAP